MPSDLIYREDAKDFVRHAYNKGLNPIEYLDEVPAADVRTVVRGKWKKRRFSELAFGYECAVCHTTWDAPTNFCPNCGAEMKPNLDTTKGDNHD